jgi:pyridoxal phosphate enzyme (YggS family)
MSIRENLKSIIDTLPPDVTLVAVSKTKPNEMILQAYEAGQKDFGENYVQELAAKHEELPKDIRWHFIGHLQSNKIKYVIPFVQLIHGVDSLKLLKEIDKQARKCGRVQDCLLQIYIAREETKFGLSFDECEEMMGSKEFGALKNVKIKGFMGMASNTPNGEEIKKEFESLKLFYDRISDNVLELSILSMGMSSDYQIALSAGSNMVRIGSTIFGERHYDR